MPVQNQMHLNAISHVAPTDQLDVNLADDYLEVRGFGKPISDVIAKQMIDTYYTDFKNAFTIVAQIENNPAYSVLKANPNFPSLKKLIDPTKQIVTGVFGKEIILQILAQRNCEGIRYAQATDQNGLNTIILYGVAQVVDENGDDVLTERNGNIVAVSKRLSPSNLSANVLDGDDDVNGEVHEEGLTISDAIIKKSGQPEFIDSISDIVLGEY